MQNNKQNAIAKLMQANNIETDLHDTIFRFSKIWATEDP